MALNRPIVLAAALVLLFVAAAPLLWAEPPFAQFIDPNPAPGNQFGATVVALSTGNVVITSPSDDAGGTDAGAVYLFNGSGPRLSSHSDGQFRTIRPGLGNHREVGTTNQHSLRKNQSTSHGACRPATQHSRPTR